MNLPESARADLHCLRLGRLVGNLQSLEFVIRLVLGKLPGARPHPTPPGIDVYSLPVRTELPLSDITSYETLRKLIGRYNNAIKDHSLGAPIDPTLVEIRDALAHGRVSAPVPDFDLHLIKFDMPDKKGMVRISYNEIITEDWFTGQTKRVREAIHKIMDADSNLERLRASN